MDTVALRFRYTESDYVRAFRSHSASRLRLPLDIAVIVVAGVLGGYLLRSGSQGLTLVLLALSGILVLLLVAALAVIPRLVFRTQPKFRDEYSLTFSSEGVHFQTAQIDSDLQWSLYTHALVDTHSFILYYGKNQFTVIPKRVFHDSAQRQTFERLLAQNISSITDKTR